MSSEHASTLPSVGLPTPAHMNTQPPLQPPAYAVPLQQASTTSQSRVRYAVAFHGDGGEYFRIWIVNLLLTLVTIGLYTPWARVRKLKYFYQHTEVAGHSLDFHGNPRRMLRGTLMAMGLFAAYGVAQRMGETPAAISLLILALIWPLLLYSALRFRLSHTSYRGLRFAFTGTLKGIYGGLALMMVTLIGSAALIGIMAAAAGPQPAGAQLLVMMLPLLLPLAVLPYGFWLFKRYVHGHLAYGTMEAECKAKRWPLYKALLVVAGGWLLFMVIVGVVALGVFYAGQATGLDSQGVLAILPALMAVLAYFVLIWGSQAYLSARMQNLFWGSTGNRHARFRSRLRARDLMKRYTKNVLFTVVTLGLYWPFAVIHVKRLRLHAVTLETRVELEEVLAQQRAVAGEAAGDAAGEMLGLDLAF